MNKFKVGDKVRKMFEEEVSYVVRLDEDGDPEVSFGGRDAEAYYESQLELVSSVGSRITKYLLIRNGEIVGRENTKSKISKEIKEGDLIVKVSNTFDVITKLTVKERK